MASVESNDVRFLRQTRQLKGSEGSNNQHHITQTDEILTVVVSKTETSPSNSNKLDDLHQTSTSDNQSNDDNKSYHSHANGNVASLKIDDVLAMNIDHQNLGNEENEDDGKIYPKSILTNCDNDKTKSLLRKKSVSFGNDEDITKFISGEEIVDKKNPFRQSNEEDYTEKYKITKVKKSIIPTKVPRNNTSYAPKASIDETDYISKEEILKQSKYVPVYIRNPDRVLTYDKSVLEKLTPSITSPKNIVKRAPVPVPRKSVNETLIKKPKEKRRTKYQWDHSKYPDLADIKVSTLKCFENETNN
jgi:ribosomal protein S10